MFRNLTNTISKIDFCVSLYNNSGPGYEATKTHYVQGGSDCYYILTCIPPGGEVSLHKNFYHGLGAFEHLTAMVYSIRSKQVF